MNAIPNRMGARRVLLAIPLVLALLLLTGAVLADGGYDLSWWTTDGGAMWSEGGGFTLGGTIGQPDAGVLTGGSYSLSGGFWGPGGVYLSFLPVIMR
jgi:hypothetical protein